MISESSTDCVPGLTWVIPISVLLNPLLVDWKKMAEPGRRPPGPWITNCIIKPSTKVFFYPVHFAINLNLLIHLNNWIVGTSDHHLLDNFCTHALPSDLRSSVNARVTVYEEGNLFESPLYEFTEFISGLDGRKSVL